MTDCIFCQFSQGKTDQKKIYENEKFFSVFDINQKVPGHSLVISKEHFVTTLDIPDELGKELLDCIKKTAKKAIEKENATGFNIVNNNSSSAGQEVHHVHYHILPRKEGDKSPLVY